SFRSRLMKPTSTLPDVVRLIAASEPVSVTIQATPGCSALNRAVRAWTAGSAPPPPVALYCPCSGSIDGAAGAGPPHPAMREERMSAVGPGFISAAPRHDPG